ASWPEPLGQPRAAFASIPSAEAMVRDSARHPVSYRFVSPEYFAVLDIRVDRGRVFTAAEAGSAPAVTIISEATARRLWPDRDAVGQVLRLEPVPRPDIRG